MKAKIKGTVETIKNLKYLRSMILGPGLSRNQSLTFDGYTETFAAPIPKLRNPANRLVVLENEFRYSNTLELDYAYLGAHYTYTKQFLAKKGMENSPFKALEVGSGYGRTILPFSSMFPNGKFYGVEYSASGPDAAARYEREGMDEIQKICNQVAKFHEKNPIAESIVRGDGKNLPFQDGEFDVSYTNLVLEQIPKPEDHMAILKQMRRVTRKFSCFLEPWADAQNFLTQAYLTDVDYFRYPSSILLEAGYSKVHYFPLDFHHNLKFRVGYVVAEV